MRASWKTLVPVIVLAGALGLTACGEPDGGLAGVRQESVDVTLTDPTPDSTPTSVTTNSGEKGGSSSNADFCDAATTMFIGYVGADPSDFQTASGARKMADDFATVAKVAPADSKDDWQNIADMLYFAADAMEDPSSMTASDIAKLQSDLENYDKAFERVSDSVDQC